jgi:hypothetical protein
MDPVFTRPIGVLSPPSCFVANGVKTKVSVAA